MERKRDCYWTYGIAKDDRLYAAVSNCPLRSNSGSLTTPKYVCNHSDQRLNGGECPPADKNKKAKKIKT